MDNQPIQAPQPPYQQPSMPQSTQPQGQAQLGMFERRIGRLGFLLGIGYWAVILIVPVLLHLIVRPTLNGNSPASPGHITTIVNIISILFGAVGIILFLPVVISLYVRRLHDVNQSGLLTLLVLVPFIDLLLFLYLLFAPGTQGPNKYGEPINSYNYWVVTGLKKPTV